MLKVSDLRLAVGEDEKALVAACARVLGLRPDDILGTRILRKSLDLRDKTRLEYVYSLAVAVADEGRVLKGEPSRRVAAFQPERFSMPAPGTELLRQRPLVVGAGPAGLFAGLILAEHGYRPLILERGQAVGKRTRAVRQFDQGGPLDPESNYLYGEGGAGTFSDGKLTCRNTGPDTDRVLEILAESKGKPEIVYESRPHLGSNRLPAVVKAIRRRIESAGGEFRFGARVDDLDIVGGAVRGVWSRGEYLAVEVVILGIGHSARDTYAMLARRGVPLVPKPFQMGVRIEQPQANVDRVRYGTGPGARLVGPADYSLSCRIGDRELFSFCMCAGGYVMPSVSEPEHFCSNGMSRSRHESPFANSGLVLTINPAELVGTGKPDPFAGIRYQAEAENRAFERAGRDYWAPIQWGRDFLEQRASAGRPPSSYARGVRSVNLWEVLPPALCERIRTGLEVFDRRWGGLFLRDATLVGPEARGSGPIRIPRDDQSRQSIGVAGLYPVGEGAGYAGGIVSAAVDGMRSAKAVIAAFQPLSAPS